MFDGGDEALVRGHRSGAKGSIAINTYLSTIVRMMAEMEQGRRPVSTLDGIASPLAARRIRHQVHEAQNGGRPGRSRRRRRTTPTAVVSARSFHPSAGVTEGVVVIRCDRRSRAYCVRLEQEGERWRLVELATPDGGLLPAVTEASRAGAIPRDEHGLPRSSGRGGTSFAGGRWGSTPRDAARDAASDAARDAASDAGTGRSPDEAQDAED